MEKVYYGKAVYNFKEINAVNKVLKNDSLSLVDGKNVKKLERTFSKLFGKKYGLIKSFYLYVLFTLGNHACQASRSKVC